MKFSIIIPTYNRGELISRTIKSVLDQNYPEFEVLIIDDGSTDNTEEIIDEFYDERITYIKTENNERGAARNKGIKLAKGDYVTFLDSDDELYPHYLETALETINNHNSPNFFHIAYEILNENEELFYKVDDLESDNKKCLIYGNPFSCIGCFLKKEVALNNSFNEDRNLSGSEDWELWFRVVAQYGFKTNHRISAKMNHHNNRSVISDTQEKKLQLRKDLALKYAFQNNAVKDVYGSQLKTIDGFGDSYIALHLAINKERKKAIAYLFKFLRKAPSGIFKKRFYVIIKVIIFSIFR